MAIFIISFWVNFGRASKTILMQIGHFISKFKSQYLLGLFEKLYELIHFSFNPWTEVLRNLIPISIFRTPSSLTPGALFKYDKKNNFT
jgi:hypothetical protein